MVIRVTKSALLRYRQLKPFSSQQAGKKVMLKLGSENASLDEALGFYPFNGDLNVESSKWIATEVP